MLQQLPSPGAAKPGDLSLDQLLASPSKALSPADRKHLKALRLAKMERWLAFALPDATIIRLACTHFKITPATATRYIAELREQFAVEAAAIEQAPLHLRRHLDRKRYERLFEQAMEAGSLSVAERCARALVVLNGTKPAEDSGSQAFIPDDYQAARGLTLDELLAAAGGEVIEAVVPGDDEP